jgi:hypothetical protein
MIAGMWLTVALLSAITSKLKRVCYQLAPLHLLNSFKMEHEAVHKHVRENFHKSGHRKTLARMSRVVITANTWKREALPSITETESSPPRGESVDTSPRGGASSRSTDVSSRSTEMDSPMDNIEEEDFVGRRIKESGADTMPSEIVFSPTTTQNPPSSQSSNPKRPAQKPPMYLRRGAHKSPSLHMTSENDTSPLGINDDDE